MESGSDTEEEIVLNPTNKDLSEVIVFVEERDDYRYPSDLVLEVIERFTEFDQSSGYHFFTHIPTQEFGKFLARFIPPKIVWMNDRH